MMSSRHALLGLALCVALALAGGPARAYEASPGTTLYRACSGQSPQICLAYLAAVMDLHDQVIAPQMGRMFCPPDDLDPRRAGQAIWRWYQENPEDLEFPAIYGAIGGLARQFPCG